MRKLAAGLVVAAVMVGAGTASATVTLTASRTDTLFTTETQFDCGELASRTDEELPYNVVRLRAEDDTGQATSFRWKLPKPNVGFLMPDDPEIDSSAGGAFAVQGFCAEVGSGCVLTKDTVKSYRRPTILWAAPTCETGLPKTTRTQFSGDTVTIRVKADGQRGRGSKTTIDVGYGRLGTPVLWVTDTSHQPDNGIGKDHILTTLLPTFSVTLEPSIVPPAPIRDYLFDNGNGQQVAATACTADGAAPGAPACTVIPHESLGPFTPNVEVRLEDDSAYCDNARTRVATCQVNTKLEVTRSPRKQTYRSGEQGEVTVTLHNRAPAGNGCTFVFHRLSCETEAKRGDFTARGSHTFEPARCEGDRFVFCETDEECGERGPCLSESHCSETTEQPCTTDAECSPRQCAACGSGETCIRVIHVPRVISPGQSVEMLHEVVELRSVLPGKTSVAETWSIQEAFGRGDDAAAYRYKIRGQPVE